MAPAKFRCTPGNWLSLVALFLTVGGIMSGIAFRVFASKDELHGLELAAVSYHEVDKGKHALEDWKIQTIQVQILNLQKDQKITNINLVKLLDRFRLTPTAKPRYEPMPPKPAR